MAKNTQSCRILSQWRSYNVGEVLTIDPDAAEKLRHQNRVEFVERGEDGKWKVTLPSRKVELAKREANLRQKGNFAPGEGFIGEADHKAALAKRDAALADLKAENDRLVARLKAAEAKLAAAEKPTQTKGGAKAQEQK